VLRKSGMAMQTEYMDQYGYVGGTDSVFRDGRHRKISEQHLQAAGASKVYRSLWPRETHGKKVKVMYTRIWIKG
jgi:hypothetical protein